MNARSHPSIAKAHDVVDVRFALPDFDKAKAFLTDFGIQSAVEEGVLVGRGAAGTPVYLAQAAADAAPSFLGFSIAMKSDGCVRALSERAGIKIEESGADKTVTLRDPDGFNVAATFSDASTGVGHAAIGRNESGTRTRTRSRLTVPKGPAEVLRLGHIVLQVANFAESLAWYQDHFGLLVSDRILAPDGETTIGAFLRCDRGDEVTDHHSIFLMQSPSGAAALEHAAFEVRDIDSLMVGAEHLTAAGYEQEWGVGRHLLGAHIFDYWLDPFGFTLEHWTDGDLIDASDAEGKHDLTALLGAQWGPPHKMIGAMP